MKTNSRKAYLRISFLFPFVIIAWLLLLSYGCKTLTTDYREFGFDWYSNSFARVYNHVDFYESIFLKNITIHIVSDRKYFNWPKARNPETGITGYADKNQLWILGKKANGKIVLNQAVLGHEFNHILRNHHREIMDPDRLAEQGL